MSLKIVLIGLGHMGRIHLEKLLSFQGVEVTGVVDVDEAALQALWDKQKLPVFSDYMAIPGDIDGVVVSSPTKTHYNVARAFLQRGCHVFVEKPITSTIEEAQALVDIAREKGLILQIGHLERFNPAYKKYLSSVTRPVFVETRRMSGFTGRSVDIDVVLDLMIHDIDLVLSIARSPVKELRAQGTCLATEKLDMASAWIEFENGCVANLTASRVSVDKVRVLNIFERDSQAHIDLLRGRLFKMTRRQGGGLEGSEYSADKVDSVKEELMEFIEAIRWNKRPSVGGEEGRDALLVAEQIKQYIAEHQSN